MPIYEYECPRCRSQWETFNRVEDRLKESCESCGRVAILHISAPAVQTFCEWTYKNRREGKPVTFRSARHRDKYLAQRGLHVMDRAEKHEAIEKSYKYEGIKRPKYKTETQKVDGKEMRVVTPLN